MIASTYLLIGLVSFSAISEKTTSKVKLNLTNYNFTTTMILSVKFCYNDH